MTSVDSRVSYEPPQGKPLGTNPWFRFGAAVLRPILNLIIKKDWRGSEKLPQSGAAIVVCNHLSYVDPLTFTHFLYNNGRAPRYLGKESVFRVPIIGTVIKGAGQIPVSRESKDAVKGLEHAIAVLKAGHLLGVYPEGTLLGMRISGRCEPKLALLVWRSLLARRFIPAPRGDQKKFYLHTARNYIFFRAQKFQF